MNNDRCYRLIADAIDAGTVNEAALVGVDDRTLVASKKISRQDLLSTYTRRLRRCGDDAELLSQTQHLVETLQSYPLEELSWIGVYPEAGGSRVFLADSDESKLIYWMKMLDIPPA